MSAFDNLKVMARHAESIDELKEVLLIIVEYLERADGLIMEMLQNLNSGSPGQSDIDSLPPGF